MTNHVDLHVKIAEVKLGRPGDRLKATLGSCVGICFLWKKENLYGLAHCLLPVTELPGKDISAKYVSQAIPSLLKLMKIEKVHYKEIEVVLAGGGNMLEQLSRRNPHHVGLLNAEAARQILKTLGLNVVSENLGGNLGRQISIDCSTGNVEIKNINEL